MDLTPQEQFSDAVMMKLAEDSPGEPREGFGDWIKPVLDAFYQAVIDLGPTISNLTVNPIDDFAVDLAVKLIKQFREKNIKIAPAPG